MDLVIRLANRRPLVFSLGVLLAWLLLGALIVFGTALIFDMPFTAPIVQGAGTMGATCVLLFLVARLGWIRKIGITTPGTWVVWALTLMLGVYLALTGFLAFFGEVSFDPRSLLGTPEAVAILGRQPIVAFTEETLFRGIILLALVRVWGKTKRGVLAAVLVQAALFGCLHALQAFAGAPLANALLNVVHTFLFGVWMGVLVLKTGSLWPAIFLHLVANAFVLIKGLSSPWIEPSYLGYLWATLFELPLVAVGLWRITRTQFSS